ncbi:nuclear transport factor 2 family protein [Leucobacter sp. NPDC015123]|uniref:nuclear transport factor 2 family protein n=1 Tax=Leucobacter sp. NPDC015123 TaxID=3364129 RepID=UPI0036F485D6
MNDSELVTRVRTLVETMYGGYIGGDRGAIDALLDPDLTMFDSASPALISGMDELNAVRAARGTDSDDSQEARTETALTAGRFTARRIGDVISATWWLRIDAVDANGKPVIPEVVRNSAVLVDTAGPLRIVQLHEGVVQHFGGPEIAGLPNV